LLVNTLGVAGLGLGLAASAIGAPSAMAQDEEANDTLVQLLQDEDGPAALEDGELKEILIQLLQEKEGDIASSDEGELQDVVFQRLQDEDGPIALQGDEDGKAVIIHRLQDAHGDVAFGDPGALSEKRAEIYAEFTAALAAELGISDADEVDAAIRIAMMSVVDARVEEGHLTEGQAEALKFLIATSDVPVPAMGMGGHHRGMFIAAHGPASGFGPEGHMAPGRAGARERIIEWAREARSEKSDEKAERGARAEKGSDSSDSQSDEDEQG
jgi:hypothetical protein